MSTLYSDQYADGYNANPINKVDPPDHNSRSRRHYFSYTAAGAIALNDVIKLCKIPKGARVWEAQLKFSDLGTVGTLDLGWAASAELDSAGVALEAADDDGFMNDQNVNSAADVILASQQQAAPAGINKKFLAEVDLQIQASAATDAAGTISGWIEFSL